MKHTFIIRWLPRQVLGIALLANSLCNSLYAQEGHPLNGSWSGNRVVDGKDSRLLVVLDLQPDQSFDGYVIEQGVRLPLQTVVLNPEDWTVDIAAAGTDKAGNAIGFELAGKLENLGSAQERTLVGTWKEGADDGEFQLKLN